MDELEELLMEFGIMDEEDESIVGKTAAEEAAAAGCVNQPESVAPAIASGDAVSYILSTARRPQIGGGAARRTNMSH